MTWVGAIGRALGALAKQGSYMAAYILGRNRPAKREAEGINKDARDANRIDEDVRRLSGVDLCEELRRK